MTDAFDPEQDFERDFQRYLAAKRTVDDRALDRRTFDRLRTELGRLDSLDVLDVGSGTGAMVDRLLSLDALPERVAYTAVDVDPENVQFARERLPDRVAAAGYAVDRTDVGLHCERDDRTVDVDLVEADAVEFATAQRDCGRTWDLLVGHALLDVIDLDGLPALLSAVPGGLCYFPITFDGGTRFAPPHPLDGRVEQRYHRHMDEKPAGSSRAGHRTLVRLHESADDVLAVGGSDWVVYPDDGEYPADEAYFLHYIVDTVGCALAEDPSVDDESVCEWVETRHRQVEAGRLTYVAHNLDVLGRAPRDGRSVQAEK